MSDLDDVSSLRERLAELDTQLVQARTGRMPERTVDLMTWSAAPRAPAADAVGSRFQRIVAAIRRTLHEDWVGFNEAIDGWTARIDERFAKR